MDTINQYSHPRIGKAVEFLHAQAFTLCCLREDTKKKGGESLAQRVDIASALLRRAIDELNSLDDELLPETGPGGSGGNAAACVALFPFSVLTPMAAADESGPDKTPLTPGNGL